jgi:hypothetical protein
MNPNRPGSILGTLLFDSLDTGDEAQGCQSRWPATGFLTGAWETLAAVSSLLKTYKPMVNPYLTYTGWWLVVLTILKNMKVSWEGLSNILWKIKHV